MSKEHTDFLEELKEFEAEHAKNNALMLEDLKFGYASDHWPEALRREREYSPHGARPCLTVNKIPTHARQIMNDMRMSRSAIKVVPVDDKADVETAKILQGIVRHIEHISNADQAYSIAAEFQVMMGVGYFRVDTEYTDPVYNEQDLRINAIRNPFSVIMDPWITDITGSDATACYVTTMVPEKAFKREYPDASVVDVTTNSQSDWVSDKLVRVAECFYLDPVLDKYVICNGIAIPTDEYDSNRDGAYDSEVSNTRNTLKWKKINGQEVIDEADKLGKYIPIVRVVGEDIDIDGEKLICGIVRRARDAQLMYDFTVSSIAERNALEPKAPWIVSAESVEGHEDEFAGANNSNSPYIPYNALSEDGTPLPPPQRQFPTPANGALINQQMGADADLQAVIGRFNANLGESGNEKSGRAIQQRQAAGDLSTFHYPDNMSRAIRQCGRVLVDLIPHYYDTERVARIIGEDDEPTQVRLDPNLPHSRQGEGLDAIYNVGLGKYDVAVTVGPSYATKRQEGMDRMQAYLSANPALWGVIGDLAIKLDDSPYSQEMAERIKHTIPKELRGAEEDEQEELDPEVMSQFQQMAEAMEMQQQQLAELDQQNQQLEQTIKGKMIEQQIKAEEHQIKLAEMEQQRVLKMMEFEHKQAELALKQQEASLDYSMEEAKLAVQQQGQQLDFQQAQFEASVQQEQNEVEMVEKQQASMESNYHAEATATGAAETREILAGLAQSTQQNGEILIATLAELAKPKSLAVTTDAEGNVTGGVSQTMQ